MVSENPSFLNRAREKVMRSLFLKKQPSTQSELARVIQQASEDEVINADTEDMINGVFDISKRRITDIMIPRSKMVVIDSNSTVEEAITVVTTYGHSRYPVYIEDKDHIQGILMAKDLLLYAKTPQTKISDIPDLLHKPIIVPEIKRVDTMLKEFQKYRFHMAVVIDEYGGVCGLVTIEDILEIIVGEINDEYETDQHLSNITKTQDFVYTVRGATPIQEFNEFFNTKLPEIDVDTVAGLVIHSFGHIPNKDEITTINDFIFKVLNANTRQVQLLQVTVPNTSKQS